MFNTLLKVAGGLFIVLVGLSVIGQCAGKRTGPASRPGTEKAGAGITYETFQRLATGMSYGQTAAILGVYGVEQSRNDIGAGTQFHVETVAYRRDAGFLRIVSCIFQNDKLMSKTQIGLK
jgi:hypothetical protein